MKRIILTFFLVAQSLIAQNFNVTGVFIDSLHKIKNVGLYKLERGSSRYIKYVKVDGNTFKIPMDGLEPGYYRGRYINKPTGRVDFIYNNENVEFSLHSKIGQESVSFLNSRENQLLDAYLYNIQSIQQKLDSVQVAYFNQPISNLSKYQEIQQKIEGAQSYYENLAKGDYCLSVIKASKRYNAPLPFAEPGAYAESTINHYFDYIDLSDKRLMDCKFLEKKILEYVFVLHSSKKDIEAQNKSLEKAIHQVLSYAKDNASLKEYVLKTVMGELVDKENNELLQKTLITYKSLPKQVKEYRFIEDVERFTKIILGAKAPNIQFPKSETLYSLNEANNYLVIFWSSACFHCLESLPKIKEFLNNNPKDITVLAVAIEDAEDKQKWTLESTKYYNWKHTLAIGKWKSRAANDYNINSTPSYFILNKEKIIVAKPNNVEELKLILEKMK